MQETLQVAHTVMNLRMHEFMGDNINTLTFRADHDASTAANELGAAVGIEPKRPKPFWVVKEYKDRFRFNGTKGGFDSRTGVTSELNVSSLIGFRAAVSERAVGEGM